MGPVETDQQLSPLRIVIFPFFDKIEILFVLALIGIEVVVASFAGIRNGWVIPVGSYAGMVAVGWMSLPSKARLAPGEIHSLRGRLVAMGMKELAPDSFVPPIPQCLRWTRSRLVVSDLEISGPGILLRGIEKRLSNQD